MKKLLCQLKEDYSCDFSELLQPEMINQFQKEVLEERIFCDTDGFKVMTILPTCQIIVHKGYRWDGCSPKFNILDMVWIGTPDGMVIGSDRRLDQHNQSLTNPDALMSKTCQLGQDLNSPITQERITHLASAVHDALGYCKRDPNMPTIFRAPEGRDLWFSPGRQNRDLLFFNLLVQKKFSLSYLYYLATRLLGPLYDLLLGKSSTETHLADPDLKSTRVDESKV